MSLHKLLLYCGVAASLMWVAADIVASLRYPGYSYTEYSVSELSAVGAPTRSFLLPLLALYSLLLIAFAVGVWMSAGSKRSLRIVAALLFTSGAMNLAMNIVNLAGIPFATMHTREGLAAAGATSNDTLHLVYAGVSVLLILLMIGFGAGAFGRGWRIYSYATIVALLAFGAWTAMDAPRVAANLPTPWMGLRERINVYGFMLWLLLLPLLLLRRHTHAAAGKPPVT